jgi:hypothetical protein
MVEGGEEQGVTLRVAAEDERRFSTEQGIHGGLVPAANGFE